jgi:hypothetical protein
MVIESSNLCKHHLSLTIGSGLISHEVCQLGVSLKNKIDKAINRINKKNYDINTFIKDYEIDWNVTK